MEERRAAHGGQVRKRLAANDSVPSLAVRVSRNGAMRQRLPLSLPKSLHATLFVAWCHRESGWC